jgi:hypothetical protein
MIDAWMAKILETKKLSYAPPLMRGDDLKKIGIFEGPIYADLLDRVRSAQLAGEIKTKDEALMLVAKCLNRSLS